MRRAVGVLLCLAFLAFGLIRMGVSVALGMQELGYLDVAEFSEPITDIERFLEDKRESQVIEFGTLSYLGYIFAMGLCLTLGSIGVFARRSWGLALIGTYLLLHAGLFLNFQTINRKLVGFGVTVVMFLVLAWARRKPAT